jgi:MFS family permease
MHTTSHLLLKRRFLPLFLTQFLGSFNDNLFKQAVVLLGVYVIFHDPKREIEVTTLAYGIYVVPFFLFSAIAGQLADAIDKTRIIRWVKLAEVGIMCIGAMGLWFGNLWLLMSVMLLMGIHSSFFGPTKYAILPQHMAEDEVLGATSMVEAGTYIAILIGIIVAGVLSPALTAVLVMALALIGVVCGYAVPPAPPEKDHPDSRLDYNIVRATYRLVSHVLQIPHLRYAILALAAFTVEATLLGMIFAPMVKNILGADDSVTTIILVVFTLGIAIGAVTVNLLLKRRVSARFSKPAALAMALMLMVMFITLRNWPLPDKAEIGQLELWDFLALPGAPLILFELLLVAIFGGIFVVPLYAFLTTSVRKAEAARVIAANNILTSGAAVLTAPLMGGYMALCHGLHIEQAHSISSTFVLVTIMCLVSIWPIHQLVRLESQESIDKSPHDL